MNDMQSRLDAVERLLKMFRVERLTYLGVNIVALVMLLGAACYLMLSKAGQDSLYVTLPVLFGSSGLITYSMGRLLTMWNQAMALIQQSNLTEK